MSGGADNAGRMFDVTTGQTSQVAQHDAPIKVVKWVETPGMGILATGSWDKTIKVRAGPLLLRLAVFTSSFAVLGSSPTASNRTGHAARALLYL